MSAGTITLSAYGSSVTLSRFSSEEFPRSYMAQATLNFSQIGTAYASGPARRQRRMWSVSAFVTTTEWLNLEAVYAAWDARRAEGDNLAVVTISDALLGSSTNYEAFFTEPPALAKLAGGNNTDFNASFVLVEV